MGYVLSLWAAPVEDLERLLGSARDGTGGGTATPDQADSVAVWLNESGQPVGSVDHSSSAGAWFRDEVLGGPVAARFGADLAGHLLARPVGGLDWDDYPSVGWVSHAELQAAVTDEARAEQPDPETDEQDVLQTITDAVVEALDSGKDLVTFYE